MTYRIEGPGLVSIYADNDRELGWLWDNVPDTAPDGVVFVDGYRLADAILTAAQGEGFTLTERSA